MCHYQLPFCRPFLPARSEVPIIGPKSQEIAGLAARTFAGERSAVHRGDYASLASAVPRAGTARFRRPPAMILGPRHASLIAASRNLERFALRRERLGRVSYSFRAASHRKTIER